MNDADLDVSFQYIQYTLSIPLKLKERLDQHILRLKYIQHPQGVKQVWLLQAVQDKLRRDDPLSLPKEKHLNVKLSEEIVEQLNALLALSPKTFTKKKWILEAIEEKIEADKILLQTKKNQLQNKKNTANKD